MTQLDMTPGAQVPRTDVGNQTAVTQAFSSAAYRNGDVKELEVLTGVSVKAGKFALFRPSAGEAFSRALIDRTLGGGRKPLVPSHGTDVRMVVEHCLAAQDLREARDRKLAGLSLLFGLLFLPGTLVWLAAYQARAWLGSKKSAARDGFIGTLALLLALGLTLLLLVRPPFGGPLGLYFRVVMIGPAVGWYLAKRTVVTSVMEQRARWGDLVGGSPVAAVVPKAVPKDHLDKKANTLKAGLDRLSTEQNTNIQHYAGPKGILGIGARWAEWSLREDLRPAEGHDDFRTFHVADLTRRIADRLSSLTSSDVPNGGLPKPQINHWVVLDTGEGADEIGRPSGPDMDGDRMRDFAVQELASKQSLGADTRHRIAVQFVLHKGQLVSTIVINVMVLAQNLQIHVTPHTLGPINGYFTAKPKTPEKDVAKTFRFWETRTVQLAVVNDDEVVRQAVRAPFHKIPGLQKWLGGGISFPEPLCLRQAWADPTWNSRYKSDDTVYLPSPVIGVIHAAVVEFLEEHDVATDRITNRSNILRSEIQGSRPFRADKYDAG
ncbi:hypothetical protein [Kitasatospora cineracea]|uniref:Uncharacterized protein n=1 Tax=Kitasatospora cineracea TaxID=88074 RepID=A0A3N4RSG3_9ACTN|nr:hypothetical protein [Kitasatospora cineracea]ROR45473.1 hypothetical protein EDD39_3713 [Kitasatospora cineracea]RPE35826.1 hypothetical protein EDD38_4193 [Kitasatospora cineracea]